MEIIHIRRFMSISVFPTTLQLLAHFGKGEGLTSQKHKVKFSYDVCLDITRQGTIKQKNPFGLGTKYPPQRIVCLSFKLRNGLSQLSLSTSQCSVHTITKPEPFSHGVSKLRRCDDVCRGQQAYVGHTKCHIMKPYTLPVCSCSNCSNRIRIKLV